uniref:RING-type domain-containing protein n=1 Tax=Chromera velia CCMP2878 TaxID=1169474 RepID=A0A0G4FQ90_9ALVE|eukprot:Cvel_18231.t1-p1 / transcript=Cvel_18231.t1 / gene=Cvel_18231 / organism=Chromera_velia_CCMP2878 / gene_product=hypothetical protein / transcript_product=hypothetical protein / location=Cvel_scaffold1498:30853-34126(+) / protein_length=374 / sequence_SO=supercontig / SO=protein_coding / is_pseudo=false
MKATIAFTLLFGFAMVVAQGPINELFNWIIFRSRGLSPILSAGSPGEDYVKFVYGITGAVIVGWMVSLYLIVSSPLWSKRDPVGWNLVGCSMASWFVLDTAMSFVTGFWPNCVLNVVFLFPFGVLLLLSPALCASKPTMSEPLEMDFTLTPATSFSYKRMVVGDIILIRRNTEIDDWCSICLEQVKPGEMGFDFRLCLPSEDPHTAHAKCLLLTAAKDNILTCPQCPQASKQLTDAEIAFLRRRSVDLTPEDLEGLRLDHEAEMEVRARLSSSTEGTSMTTTTTKVVIEEGGVNVPCPSCRATKKLTQAEMAFLRKRSVDLIPETLEDLRLDHEVEVELRALASTTNTTTTTTTTKVVIEEGGVNVGCCCCPAL